MSERLFRVRELSASSIRHAFVLAWNAAKTLDRPFEIVIRFLKDKRTIEQNRRMWKLLREVAATVWMPHPETGVPRQFADKVWHLFFREMFIGVESTEMPDGSVKREPISTTKLDVEAMTAYMRDIETWCDEQGYPVMEATA